MGPRKSRFLPIFFFVHHDELVGLHTSAVSREVASVVATRHRTIERALLPSEDVVSVLAKTPPAPTKQG